ncbi:Bacterial SH3 domain protein [bacterium YEK0313]|nr:Bacterial SH3 domain protein [bacterium YEK0313]
MQLRPARRRRIGVIVAGAMFAALSFPAAAQAAEAYVTADVNMRTGPGTGYARVLTLPEGAAVNVQGCSGAWCRVAYRGAFGWVSRAYLDGAGGAVEIAPPVYEPAPPVYVPPPVYVQPDYYPPPYYGRPPHWHRPPPGRPPGWERPPGRPPGWDADGPAARHAAAGGGPAPGDAAAADGPAAPGTRARPGPGHPSRIGACCWRPGPWQPKRKCPARAGHFFEVLREGRLAPVSCRGTSAACASARDA